MNNLAEEVEETQSFVIDDLSKAEWAMKKIAHSKAKITDLQTQAQKMRNDVDMWLQKEAEHETNNIAYFEALLQPFIAEQLKDSKKKSLSLPSGKAGYRAGATKFKFNGVEVDSKLPDLIEYVKANSPDFIKKTETVKWADYKKTLTVTDEGAVVTADGEIIEQMNVEKGEDKFYTEVK